MNRCVARSRHTWWRMTEARIVNQPTRRVPRWLWFGGFVVLGLGIAYGGLFWLLRNPTFGVDAEPSALAPLADARRLEQDVRALAAIRPSRSLRNPAALILAARYVERELAATGCRVSKQAFSFRRRTYENLTCSFGPDDGERVILGAHYDVFQPRSAEEPGQTMFGADDNASGVAGILEVARLVAALKPSLEHRLDLVAFTLEEYIEPIGNDDYASIGSHRYVQKLRQDGASVKLMLSVEMIGYFSDEAGSQRFPAPLSPLLALFYPTRGNFIGVIGRTMDRGVVARVRDLMKRRPDFPVHSINAPAFVPGIDRSDHKNFWAAGYPAAMVTDTAEFRNANYHTANDTPDTLDYARMAQVVSGLYQVGIQY